MNTLGRLALKSLAFLAIANLNFVNANAQSSPRPAAQANEKADSTERHVKEERQLVVVCTGWHALCTASPDCQVNGDIANCDCMRVNETHIVATDEIQNASVKRLTQAKCTTEHPCDVDQAPICKTIRDGKYELDNVKYDWVSTYSYRGWCGLLKQIKLCEPGTENYSGDSTWAICDVAPCTESQNPSDPARPLSCQCRVQKSSFVGMNGSCTGDKGGIMSSMPTWAWDFQKNTYPFPMPGYEFVQGACASVSSDPAPPPKGAALNDEIR